MIWIKWTIKEDPDHKRDLTINPYSGLGIVSIMQTIKSGENYEQKKRDIHTQMGILRMMNILTKKILRKETSTK